MGKNFRYIPDKEYFAMDGVSNSQLSCMIHGPEHYLMYKDKEQEKKEHNIFGSLVHCLLLEPDEFLSRYFIMQEGLDIPSGQSQAYKAIHLAIKQNMFTPSDQLTGASLKQLHEQLGVKRSIDIFHAEIFKYVDYIEALRMARDKEVISQEQLMAAQRCVMSIGNHPKYSEFFDINLPAYNEHCVEWIPEGFNLQCKGKIDRCIINKKAKKLILIDLKTTGKPIGLFQQSYKSFEYYRQVAFYLNGLLSWLGVREGNFGSYYDTKDLWDVSAYIIVVEKQEPYCCRFVKVSQSEIQEGIKRWKELLSKLQWHIENDIWISRELIEGDGVVEYNLFNSYEEYKEEMIEYEDFSN